MSDSLRPHELQHARPPCPSQNPRVHSDSCPSSWWCHPAISSCVVPFSSCPQTLLASQSFPMSQLFAWGGQSTGVSASASFLPKNTQGWSPSEWTGWISLQSKGLSRVFSNTAVQKHQFFSPQLSSQSNSHPYMTTGKTIALTRQTFVGKVMPLLLTHTIHTALGKASFIQYYFWDSFIFLCVYMVHSFFIADVDRFGDCTYKCRFSVLLIFTLYWSIVD